MVTSTKTPAANIIATSSAVPKNVCCVEVVGGGEDTGVGEVLPLTVVVESEREVVVLDEVESTSNKNSI